MPLPALIIPTAYAIVTTTTTVSTASAATGAIIGVGAVATDIAAIGVGVWSCFFKKTPAEPSAEHQASLRRQKDMSNKRLADATETVELVKQEVKTQIEEAVAATASASTSSQQLQQSVEVLVETTQHLQDTAHVVVASGETLALAIPTLEQLSMATQHGLEERTTKLETLNQQLSEQHVELSQAQKDMRNLSATIDSQAVTIVQLTSSLQALATENDGLRSTIEHQDKKYKRLEAAAKHADNNHRLFRRVVEEAAQAQKESATSPSFFK